MSGDAGSGTQAFSYDGLARVTAGAGLATTLAYSYDRDGNRLTRTAAGSTTTYSYDRTGALISRVDGGTTTYDAYDGYGTLTSYASAVNQVTTLTVDLGDRVTSVTRPGGGNATTSFTLDALGRVASRTLPGAPLETISYLGTSDTVSVLASSAGTTSSALDPAGQRVANAAGGSTGFLLADLHGNQGAVVNASESALTSASRYDPFGATAATWDSGSGVPTPWRFQGRWDLLADQTDPLYAAGARAYLPATATFTSLDSYPGSVANPTSLNRYLYAAANPWTLIDPSGHYVLKDAQDGVGAAVADPAQSLATGDTSDPTKIVDVIAVVATTVLFPLGIYAGGALAASTWASASTATLDAAIAIRAAAQVGGAAGALNETCRRFCEAVGEVVESLAGVPNCSAVTCRPSAISVGPGTGEGPGAALARRLGDTDVMAPTRGGYGPVAQGAVGVARTAQDLIASGGSVEGREITVLSNGLRTRIDLVVRLPNGQLVFLEVKTGPTARLSANQKAAFDQITQFGGFPVGRRAAEAEMPTQLPPTPIWVVHQPWPLPGFWPW